MSPNRVKIGGSDINEEGEERETWLVVIAPRSVGDASTALINFKIVYMHVNTVVA